MATSLWYSNIAWKYDCLTVPLYDKKYAKLYFTALKPPTSCCCPWQASTNIHYYILLLHNVFCAVLINMWQIIDLIDLTTWYKGGWNYWASYLWYTAKRIVRRWYMVKQGLCILTLDYPWIIRSTSFLSPCPWNLSLYYVYMFAVCSLH